MPVMDNLLRDFSKGKTSNIGLTGQSLHTRQVNMQIHRIAKTNLTVLIQGGTGTGKELIARCLHACSDRAAKPFIEIGRASCRERV